MKLQIQGPLLTSFLKIGVLGFGGGPSMVPLIHHEVVKRRGWMPDEEFGDVLAIANTLPGPIATKLPGYIGYRVGGFAGCLTAVLAIIFPMIVAMILLLGVFSAYRDVDWIRGMGQGVVPVVMVMMMQLTWDFWDKSRSSLGWLASALLVALAGILIYGMDVHPAFIIITLLAAAILVPVDRFASILRRVGK